MEPPPTNNTLISHHPPSGSASLDETLPQIDKPVTLNKMKELKFSFGNVLPSLALLQPKPDCFITRKDIDSSGNVIRHTARVTIGGAHYESVDKSEQFAKQKAAYKAISNFSDEEALKLSILAQEKLKSLNRKLFRGRERKRAFRASVKRRAEKEAQEEEESKRNKVDVDEVDQNDEDSNPSDCENTKGSEQDHSFGDYISKLVEDGFKSIVKGDRSMSNYKVLAGVVMSSGIAINGSQVICVATGDDCINGRHLSVKGEAVNDCHAVILARRELVSFLYDQLEKYRIQPEESVFELAGNNDGLPLRLKIKDGILFHLYVSSPPCGDACLSSNSSTSFKLGALQTKVEGAEGGITAPVSSISNQTMDDFYTGQLLMTMSCSDKMARWNVVGAQGSLLSHLINPVYFHSVVIGNLLHPESAQRAIIGRIENLKDIPDPFMVMQPIIATTSVRKNISSIMPKISVCWVKGWIHHEMIDCITGKMLKMEGRTGLSELCKFRFFKRFVALASTNPKWKSLIQPSRESGSVTYGKMKATAEGFRKVNELFMDSLMAAGLGRWIKKPSEHDLFQIDF